MKTNFFVDVYEVVKLIPSGRVTSYGSIAEYLGSKGSSRMVGWAMNNAQTMREVPAHRVVNRNGLLTGKAHFNPPSKMQELLKKEGVSVENDKIINFKTHYWNPVEELAL